MCAANSANSLACVLCLLLMTTSGMGQITTPEEYLGYKPGDDFKLATYEKLVGYFDLLDSQSGRLMMADMGETSEGRRMRYAIISSEENMAKLEHYQEIVRKLSLARELSQEEAEQLAREGKVVVWIDSGMHASEISGSMHQFQLAYEMVTETDPQLEFIRDNVILLLVIANPDGMTIVSDWYMQNVGTQYEKSSLPVLYQKYSGHDNNRDSFMANLSETQNMNRVIGAEWHPQLMYVQHESAPFPARIWMPPNPEPVNPNIHPIVTRWKNLIGSAMGQAFDANDQPGALSRTSFDLWYPGYADGPAVELHNIPSILTETANYGYASPRYYTIGDFPEAYRDLTIGTFYPSPWEGGWWRFADAVAYNITASKSVLDVAAKYRYEFLSCKYQMGQSVIDRFKNEPPYGWIIPADQLDPNTTALMLNRFILFGIEIYQADEAFEHEGVSYAKGSYILPTSQAFGLFVKAILEKQEYPDLRKYGHLWQGLSSIQKWDGAPLAPYDGVGWTLPIQMGIDAVTLHTPLTTKMTLINEAVPDAGVLAGNGSQYSFPAADNHSYIAVNKILRLGGKVRRAPQYSKTSSLGSINLSEELKLKDEFLVDAKSIDKDTLRAIARETQITFKDYRKEGKKQELEHKRVALYKSWSASMDYGWISYVLDQYEFPFHALTNAEVRAGKLRDRFDVIILPDQNASAIINGRGRGTMPPKYVGGIAMDGMEKIVAFVEQGGTLVCNKGSSDFAITYFDLPLRNVLQGVDSSEFNCPGSLLKMNYDTSHKLTFGMQEKGMAYFGRAQTFDYVEDAHRKGADKISVAARYSEKSLLLSGWIIGEEKLHGKMAVIDAAYGKGHIIMYGFSFHNRAQSYANFKLLFNAIYY